MNRNQHHPTAGHPSLSAFIRNTLSSAIWHTAEDVRMLCDAMHEDKDTPWSDDLVRVILWREYRIGNIERKKICYPHVKCGPRNQYLYRGKS